MVFEPYQLRPGGKWYVRASGKVHEFDTREEAAAWAADRRRADRERNS